ncbi:hypothetical protein AB6N23_00425 [Cellulomonas sp. 179-A 9B4 NHS]|uniref:hypothetical protein n=1 Tax=Cellulomonas sp. 179-A 9B4 NHS TaxID=3142379 RepID=UPI0039A0E69E
MYSTGVAWQAQAVSYPLFGDVGAAEFAAYHLAYGAAIPWVVVVPGFVGFLAAAALPWTRPADVPRPLAAVAAAGGLVSIGVTVLWAIPMHDRLDAAGFSPDVLDSLLRANAVRTGALTVAAVALVGALLRRRAA